MSAIDDELRQKLAAIVGPDAVLRNEPMARHTTFEIGGPADWFIRPASVSELARVVDVLAQCSIPWRVIGRGSDLLVSDAGLRFAVIEVGARMASIAIEGSTVTAAAGAANKDVAEAACAAGLAGYEFASGIPGTVGGAAIMNAGAYDGEFKDVCTRATCIDSKGNTVEVPRDEADWSYRHSAFAERGLVVVEVQLALQPDNPAAVRARMDDLQQRRASKQPLEMPSAGSTFKRPTGYYVGKLIQDCGLRGYRVGGAQVSEKHTGFVVNAGGASAADVRQLIANVQATVHDRFDVDLHPEVRMWGFEGQPEPIGHPVRAHNAAADITFAVATLEHLDAMCQITDQAKRQLRGMGLDQWQKGYPSRQVWQLDISEGCTYLALRDGRVVGQFAFQTAPDASYAEIDGAWLTADDAPYASLHRVCVADGCKGQGIAGLLFAYGFDRARDLGLPSVRIDTHPENQPMLHALQKAGFIRCGTIRLAEGAEAGDVRVAFERLL